MEPWELDLAGLATAYRRRSLRPSEVVDSLLNRIEKLDAEVGAFRQVLADQATVAAAESDHRMMSDPRPLEGIPVAIKELFDVAGAGGCYGSEVMAGRVAPVDAAAVTRLRRAGAVIVGTTRSHEFGWGITTQHAHLGSTVNPWSPDRVPGGSSGGSAAALATGMVPLALGSDTGGSIRIPAAYCGVVGFKPTYGRVPKVGAVALAPSLDHPGPMARTVADCRTALLVLAGHHPADPSTRRAAISEEAPTGRLGVCPDLHPLALADSYAAAYRQTIDRLADAGWEVVEVGLAEAATLRPAFNVIQMAEAHHYHSAVLGTFPAQADRYGPDVRHRLEMAAEIDLASYLDAQEARTNAAAAFAALFADRVDVLLTPVAAGGPSGRAVPDRAEHRGEVMPFRDLVMGFTVPQDLAGIPAVAVPVGRDQDGIPIGMQFTSAADNEWIAAAAASQAMVEPGWPPSGGSREERRSG
jgi:aspartyl-tRNA(Asn)/glutamyl-tRNA(Gln) amidotransferase subunit A